MPAGYAVARARPLLPRAEVRAPSAVRPPSRGHCSRGREHRGNCRHAKGRTRAPDVAGADERASRSRILALWEDRSAPHPAAATRKPRNRAEASGRVQRGGANDPPRAPFLRPAPPRTSRGLPDRSFRRCSGVPRRSANRVTEREARGNYHHAKGLDAKGRTRPPPQGFVQIPVIVRGVSTTPLHPPLYEKKRRSGESRGVVDGKRRSRRSGPARPTTRPRLNRR